MIAWMRGGERSLWLGMSLFIRHARILTLAAPTAESRLTAGARARRGAELKELGIIPRGHVLITDGTITATGPDLTPPPEAEVIDADGRVLMPGFVDCHTHACWAGDRLNDWEQSLSGVSPGEIIKRGGGFLSTVRAVREATRKQLAAALRLRLDQIIRGGTTTVEVKSGYGLTIEAESKMLHAIQRAAQEWPGTVVPTALLGQGIEGDAAAHTRMVVREMLPAIWHEFPGITIDACCEESGWPVEACVRLFDRAIKHGLTIRVHADQAASSGMIPEALRLHARSVDHLENATKADLLALAASDTFGVITPAMSFHSGARYAPWALRACVRASAVRHRAGRAVLRIDGRRSHQCQHGKCGGAARVCRSRHD